MPQRRQHNVPHQIKPFKKNYLRYSKKLYNFQKYEIYGGQTHAELSGIQLNSIMTIIVKQLDFGFWGQKKYKVDFLQIQCDPIFKFVYNKPKMYKFYEIN